MPQWPDDVDSSGERAWSPDGRQAPSPSLDASGGLSVPSRDEGFGLLVHDYLTRAAVATPEAPALLTREGTWTFDEVERASRSLAAGLQHTGLGRGDRVAIVADNSFELVVALWGTLRAGGVFVVVNPTTKADKLGFILRDCSVGTVVAQRKLAPMVTPAVGSAPSVRTVLWAGRQRAHGASGDVVEPSGSAPEPGLQASTSDEAGDATTVEHRDMQTSMSRDDAVVRDSGLIDADLAGLVYTSGSTGKPKGVILTHRNVAHNAWSISTYLGLRPDDLIGCLLPLSFDYGLFQVFMAARVGCTVALEGPFAYPRDTLARLAAIRATVLPGVPTIFAAFLQQAPLDHLDLSCIRLLTNTAAALPPAHIERLEKAFPQATLFSMYGLTECTRVSYLPPDRLVDKPTSVGRAMPNTDAYVVDEAGRRVGPGVVGELVVRGASVMRGYWNRSEETAACLRDGELEGEKVLHTGDRFWADEEGFLYFAGRKDDLFKCKGEKVSPREIEQVLYELESVTEAAVVGAPDEIDGTAIRAVVATRPGSTLRELDVRRHCRARLESHMVPRYVEIRDELPKTPSGKIHKATLLAETPAPSSPTCAGSPES